jgi:hypothetical protein
MRKPPSEIQLPRLLPAIRDEFALVEGGSSSAAPAHAYEVRDVLMAGLAMMFVQDPSMCAFQRRLVERRGKSNFDTIFGVEQIPEATQFRRILDPLDPVEVQRAFCPCLRNLQKTRLWSSYRVLGGRYAVLLDGFEFFRSEKKGCSGCLEYHHRNGRVDYAHQAVVATIAHPSAKRPIPLILEEIRREDGASKQDCESNAAKRLIPALAKLHCHLDMVIVADGLYSKLPMIRAIREAGMAFVLVAKPSDHKTLEENLTGLRSCGGVQRRERRLEKGRQATYEWVNRVELTAKDDHVVNWLSYTETALGGKILYRNTWVTNIELAHSNVVEVAEVGRHRWQIENQAFNVLKNHGHHLEHNFGHGEKNLAFNFVVLNFIAYFLHQVIALADHLFQAAAEKVGGEYKLWDDIRVLFKHFVWGSWEILLEHILDYRDDTGFDSG